jgi:hypothetical protein
VAPIEQLHLVAEISAAFLGFIAIFVALSNDQGRFSGSDRHFIQTIVLASSLAIVQSFIPQTLLLYFDEAAAWFYSLVLAGFGGLVFAILMGLEQWHMPKEEAVKVNMLWHVPPWCLGLLIFSLMNYAIFTGDSVQAAYITSATLTIPMSLWCFIALVFRRFF